MRIGILGSNGHIGSFTLARLQQLRYDVRGIDRIHYSDFDFGGCDTLVNSAWIKAELQDLSHLDFARQTINMMEAAKSQGIRIINLGSHSEYSIQDTPQVESDLCEPVTTYGLAKLMVTLHAKKLGYNTLRLFAVYGGDKGRTFKDIVNKEGAMYSHPENVKDFIPVGMVANAIERLLHMQHLYGEIINVCSGTQESARELALRNVNPEDIAEQERIMERFYQYPMKQTEPSETRGNPDKMIKLLNINPGLH